MNAHNLPIRFTNLAIAVSISLILPGCSRHTTDTYQGYVEGKFVYVASAQAGRLTHLSVTRGDTIAVSHPLFSLDREPEAAAERQAQQLVRGSEARLADLQTGKRPPEIDVIALNSLNRWQRNRSPSTSSRATSHNMPRAACRSLT